MDWKEIVRLAAPGIGTALLGPAGGAAVKFLGDRLLGNPDASESEVAVAVRELPPQQQVELTRLEHDFTLRMRELGIDVERLHLERQRVVAADRASAREREARTGDTTPRNLAYIYTLGFFAVLGVQLAMGLQGVEIPDSVLRTIDVATGVLFAFVMASKDYYLGSSAGSVRKTELLSAAGPGLEE